jgi:hypothetical protein
MNATAFAEVVGLSLVHRNVGNSMTEKLRASADAILAEMLFELVGQF